MTQDIKRLTRTRLLAILDEAPAGAAYVFGTRMRALFQFAVERGYLSENPMAGVSIPKTEGEHRPWTAAELSAFMADDVDEQLRMGILLAYYTAQREGDVLKMRWADIIEGEAIFVVQEKTGIRLFAPIHPELKVALDKHPRTGETIVCMPNGSPYTTETFRRKFARERDRLGLSKDVKFHGLRKTIAAMLAAKGATSRELMAVGGWTNSKMVDLYTRGAEQFELAKSAMRRLG